MTAHDLDALTAELVRAHHVIDDVSAERDRLRAERDRLRAALLAILDGAGTVTAAERVAEVLQAARDQWMKDYAHAQGEGRDIGACAPTQAAALLADPGLLVDLAIEAGGLEQAHARLPAEPGCEGFVAIYAEDNDIIGGELDVWTRPEDAAHHVPLYRRTEADR